MNWRANILCCFVVSLAMLGFAYEANGAGFCEPQAIVKAYLTEDYERAIDLNNACIEHYEIATTGVNPHGALSGTQWLDVLRYGYHICTGSQLAAASGRLLAAKDMLDTAKRYARSWPFVNPLVQWSSVITLTEGFYLEMAGREDDAERFYRQNLNPHTHARLGVLALRREDHNEAVRWAGDSLRADPQNITAQIVLAAVSDAGSVDRSAADALRVVLEQGGRPNEFMPAYYAEVWWSKVWMERAGRIGAPPLVD